MKDKIQHWLVRALMLFFGVELVLASIAHLLRNVDSFHLAVAVLIVSGVAYFVRIHRKPRQIRPRSTSTGERTPMMPRSDR